MTWTKKPGKDERFTDPNDSVKVEQLHLYAVTEDEHFVVLNDDDVTVEDCKINSRRKLWGMNPDDICSGSSGCSCQCAACVQRTEHQL